MKQKYKLYIKLTTLICILIACNTSRESPGNIKYKDPFIARADIVFDSAPGLTPYVMFTPDGSMIAQWATGWGDGMPGQATQFAMSSDTGKKWSEPYMTIASDKPLTGSGTNLFPLPDGNWNIGRMLCYTLEISWTEQPDPKKSNWPDLVAGRKFDSYYSFSNDNGHTFSEKVLLSDPVKRNDFSQGNIVELPNGDLIWPWGSWGSEPINGFRRSVDGGNNWSPIERAWQDPPPGFDKPVSFNETAAAVCKDGTIVAIARVDGLPGNDKRFWKIKSFDNGKTWTVPVQIEISGGSPAMYHTPKGQLWLAYRDGGLGPGLGFAVSDDNGDSWRFLFHLKDPKGEHEKLYGHIRYTDDDRKKPWRQSEGIVGYPCFARLSDKEVYVVFHAHNKGEMAKSYPDVPFYIAGNLLRIP